MTISRRQLYAAGEPFGACATAQKLGGGYWCGGGDSSSSSESKTTTINTDKRVAVSDGVGVSGDGNITIHNDTDAVKALAQAGADIIKSSGGAVVELGKMQSAANTDAWNKTLTESGKLVDRLIDKVSDGFTLSSKVVDSFQPSENKQTDALKYGLIAAAAVAAAVLLKGSK